MNIYQSLKNHSLLDYVQKCSCCDLDLLAYYQQNDIIAELEKNYLEISEEMERVHEHSMIQEEEMIEPETQVTAITESDVEEEEEGQEELMGEREEASEKSYLLVKKFMAKERIVPKKPRETEYVQGLDNLVENIKTTGTVDRTNKEILMAGLNNQITSRHLFDLIMRSNPYFVPTDYEREQPTEAKDKKEFEEIKGEISQDADREEKELLASSEDFCNAFRKKWHLPPVGIPFYYPSEQNYYSEHFSEETKRDGDERFANDQFFCKDFKEIFNIKEFVEREKKWDEMMNRPPYFMHGEDHRIGDSVRNAIKQKSDQTSREISFESGADYPISDPEQYVDKKIKQETSNRGKHGSKVEAGEDEKPATAQQAKKACTRDVGSKASNLRKELYKFFLDEMLALIHSHFQCKGQHDEYKKVHRELISKKEYTKLLSMPQGPALMAYERELIDRAKKRTKEKTERWHPRKETGLACAKNEIAYPFTKNCLKYEYFRFFAVENALSEDK